MISRRAQWCIGVVAVVIRKCALKNCLWQIVLGLCMGKEIMRGGPSFFFYYDIHGVNFRVLNILEASNICYIRNLLDIKIKCIFPTSLPSS